MGSKRAGEESRIKKKEQIMPLIRETEREQDKKNENGLIPLLTQDTWSKEENI